MAAQFGGKMGPKHRDHAHVQNQPMSTKRAEQSQTKESELPRTWTLKEHREHKAFPRPNIEREPAKQEHDKRWPMPPTYPDYHHEEPKWQSFKREMDAMDEAPNMQNRHEYLKGRTHFQKRLAVEAQHDADEAVGRKEDYHYRPKHAEATGQENLDELLETKERTHFRDTSPHLTSQFKKSFKS